jgi:chemotaxis protein CheD
VTQDPQWVITLLGSCVAVTLYSPRFRLAAICHAMLPGPCPETSSAARDPRRFRFMSCAIPEMLARFQMAGLGPSEIEVKMFGGGNVLDLGDASGKHRWIGAENITAARQFLHAARLAIRAENVGGNCGCKIAFNTLSGEVLHKSLSAGTRSPLESQERVILKA